MAIDHAQRSRDGETRIGRAFSAAESRLPPTAAATLHTAHNGEILLSASSLAFYALVSLAPLLIVGFWLTSMLGGSELIDRLAEQAEELVPQGADLSDMIERLGEVGTGAGFGAVAAALWPATAYGAGLRRAFDQLSAGRDGTLRGMRGRIAALLLILAVPVLVFVSLPVTYLVSGLDRNDELLAVAGGWALALLAGGLAAGMASALLYRFFAPVELSWGPILKGATTTAVGIGVLAIGFSLYLHLGADFEERYATSGMAVLVLLALWLFLANLLLLVGYTHAAHRAGQTPDQTPVQAD